MEKSPTWSGTTCDQHLPLESIVAVCVFVACDSLGILNCPVNATQRGPHTVAPAPHIRYKSTQACPPEHCRQRQRASCKRLAERNVLALNPACYWGEFSWGIQKWNALLPELAKSVSILF